MQCFRSIQDANHNPSFFLSRGRVLQCPESPQRAAVLHDALKTIGHHQVAEAAIDEARTQVAIRAVHGEGYLEFLQTAWKRWQALGDSTDEVIPNVHPSRNMQYLDGGHRCPSDHIVAQAGFYQADTSCPITEGTWHAAVGAAATALTAARFVADGQAQSAYALCRPPGHHAYSDQAGGFCYLNNSAIAAQYLVEQGAGRVAIVDVDVHHGNGTQGIFYSRGDILTVSLHGDPSVYYPYFSGHAYERGIADGEGFNRNVPLPAGTGDDVYLPALEHALQDVHDFAPDAVVIALGLDASGDDPLAFLDITSDGFARIGERLGQLARQTVLVQEGGYLSEILGHNLTAFLTGFESSHTRAHQ